MDPGSACDDKRICSDYATCKNGTCQCNTNYYIKENKCGNLFINYLINIVLLQIKSIIF